MRLLAIAMAVVLVPVAAPRSAPAPAPAPMAPPATVTLVTGDQVTVAGDAISVTRGPGRAGVRFVGWTSPGHRYVVPADALPLVRDGRLDQRLFDVTTLRDLGRPAEALPVLISYPRSGNRKGPAAARAATGAAARVDRDLAGVGMLAARVRPGAFWDAATMTTATGRVLRPGVERIHLDGRRTLALDVSVPQIGAPVAWQAGLDGTGVTVAVLDSGIDATHPDFAGRLAAVENFTSDPSADDTVGHGTHVASTIAGSGARSGGRLRGVAPGARLAIGKVCEVDRCAESAVLAGMEWAARIAPVVSMSLGGRDTEGVDPLEQAVDDLTARYGALFVVAAGNDGGAGTIGPLGSARSALTVGAVDDEDRLADFSSRGPRDGDDAIKPDITAPGVGIVAAAAAHGTGGTPAGDGYVSLDGTSMAAPHVAGAAAIVAQQHPGWSPGQRKALLMGTARPTPGVDAFGQGAGRVDVARAVRQAVWADEGSVSFGRQAWPHDDDEPVTRTLTYRNEGAGPITLGLALEDGAGTFTLGAAEVTVPAGGGATTTVTADTNGAGSDGLKTGRIIAIGPGGVKVETPVAVNREVESYDVTVRHIGRDGEPAGDHYTSLNRLDGPGVVNLGGPDAVEALRLPKGDYGLYGWITGEAGQTMLVQPRLVVDGPETVTLDARRGRPFDITVPATDARLTQIGVDTLWQPQFIGAITFAERAGDTFTALVGPHEKVDGFHSSVAASFDGAHSYDVAYRRKGTFFTGLTRKVSAGELATIKAGYARNAAGVDGFKTNVPIWDDGVGGLTAAHRFAVPAVRTEHVNTDGGVRWLGRFEEGDHSIAVGPAQRLAAGRVYRQRWNRAVFAPAVDDTRFTAARSGDVIVAGIPLFASGDGQWTRSATDRARTALYAGGELVGEEPADYAEFEVPPEPTNYRLEMSATRSAPFRLSTSVSGVWTFSSANGDTALPLPTVGFRPRLDDDNIAPPGRFSIPATVARGDTLSAEYSIDDGRTWRPAPMSDRRTLRVDNPAAGFVSLRATVAGPAGNRAVVTVLRAYETGLG
ncbi:S8 family serine peptidase [Actinoplanes sp. NPDC089786]|uniref:S8 family serine peptidase n=1 Tax=Actinoplanes sp. NPDC089786 TaxID=3155185 RepID=UPI0034347AD5